MHGVKMVTLLKNIQFFVSLKKNEARCFGVYSLRDPFQDKDTFYNLIVCKSHCTCQHNLLDLSSHASQYTNGMETNEEYK